MHACRMLDACMLHAGCISPRLPTMGANHSASVSLHSNGTFDLVIEKIPPMALPRWSMYRCYGSTVVLLSFTAAVAAAAGCCCVGALLEHLDCGHQPHAQGRGAKKHTHRAGRLVSVYGLESPEGCAFAGP